MQKAIEKTEKALEVLAWCQENADEKWMVDHLALVRKHINQALAKLREIPKPIEFTKEMREKHKYSIKNKLCIYAGTFVKALNIIDQQAEQHKEDENIYKQVAEHNDILIAENKQLQKDRS